MRFLQLIEQKDDENHPDIHYGAGVLIYCPKTNRFLLQKRGENITDPGQHDYFGGGVDEGETILGAAIRELYEEGGVLVSDPATLYQLAILGKKPEEGLGGYHIFLRISDEEFDCTPAYEGDTNDEVASCDWIGKEEIGKIDLHDRVSELFADPGFKSSMKKAYREHKNREGDNVDKYSGLD